MINPSITVNHKRERFELQAMKLEPKTFWSEGQLTLLGRRGGKRAVSLRELPANSPIGWKIDTNATGVKVLITGYSIVCGEYDNETVKLSSVTISGPPKKIKLLQRSILKNQGFALVE